MADNNPHQFSTQTTNVTFAQITDDTDFPHTGLIKALSLMGKGNMALKGSVTDFDITQATTGNVVVVKSGKIYRDGALQTIPSSGADTNFTSSAFDTSTGGNSYYHLLVADSSNTLQIRKHGSSTANKVPEYTEGDTIIAVIMFNSSTAALGSMQIQFLTTGKVENSLSVGYSTGSSPNEIYNEAGSLTGTSDGITMTGLYKLDTLPTATVATDDKVIIQDTNDSDKIKTVTTQAIANLASVANISDADGDTKIQMEESSDEDKIRFDTAGTERMIIDNAGNVGIGTTSPDAPLHVETSGTGDAIIIESTDTGGGGLAPDLVLKRNTSVASEELGNIRFLGLDDGAAEQEYADLYAGINTNTASNESGEIFLRTIHNGTLRRRIDITKNELVINEDSIDSNFRVEGNGDANMLFVDAGLDKVGIGTNAPTEKLSVSGGIGASAYLGSVTEITGHPATAVLNLSASTHRTIIADTQTFDPAGPSGGPLALTLPAASGAHQGWEMRIIAKNSAAAADALVLNVAGGSDVIIDATGATIGNASAGLTLVTGKVYTVIHVNSTQYMAIVLN
jgi:hypothetical protein